MTFRLREPSRQEDLMEPLKQLFRHTDNQTRPLEDCHGRAESTVELCRSQGKVVPRAVCPLSLPNGWSL